MQLARTFRQRAFLGVLEYQLASTAILSRQLKSQSNYQLNCQIADAIYKFEKNRFDFPAGSEIPFKSSC